MKDAIIDFAAVVNLLRSIAEELKKDYQQQAKTLGDDLPKPPLTPAEQVEAEYKDPSKQINLFRYTAEREQARRDPKLIEEYEANRIAWEKALWLAIIPKIVQGYLLEEQYGALDHLLSNTLKSAESENKAFPFPSRLALLIINTKASIYSQTDMQSVKEAESALLATISERLANHSKPLALLFRPDIVEKYFSYIEYDSKSYMLCHSKQCENLSPQENDKVSTIIDFFNLFTRTPSADESRHAFRRILKRLEQNPPTTDDTHFYHDAFEAIQDHAVRHQQLPITVSLAPRPEDNPGKMPAWEQMRLKIQTLCVLFFFCNPKETGNYRRNNELRAIELIAEIRDKFLSEDVDVDFFDTICRAVENFPPDIQKDFKTEEKSITKEINTTDNKLEESRKKLAEENHQLNLIQTDCVTIIGKHLGDKIRQQKEEIATVQAALTELAGTNLSKIFNHGTIRQKRQALQDANDLLQRLQRRKEQLTLISLDRERKLLQEANNEKLQQLDKQQKTCLQLERECLELETNQSRLKGSLTRLKEQKTAFDAMHQQQAQTMDGRPRTTKLLQMQHLIAAVGIMRIPQKIQKAVQNPYAKFSPKTTRRTALTVESGLAKASDIFILIRHITKLHEFYNDASQVCNRKTFTDISAFITTALPDLAADLQPIFSPKGLALATQMYFPGERRISVLDHATVQDKFSTHLLAAYIWTLELNPDLDAKIEEHLAFSTQFIRATTSKIKSTDKSERAYDAEHQYNFQLVQGIILRILRTKLSQLRMNFDAYCRGARAEDETAPIAASKYNREFKSSFESFTKLKATVGCATRFVELANYIEDFPQIPKHIKIVCKTLAAMHNEEFTETATHTGKHSPLQVRPPVINARVTVAC